MDTIVQYAIAFASSGWAYFLIFGMAVLEASIVTSYLMSGTIGFVIVGVLVAKGILDPIWSVLAIHAGTVVGDLSNFVLATALQRIAFVKSAIAKIENLRIPLQKAPTRFILVGHFAPYLRAVLPVLAAGVVPLRVFVPLEIVGAFLGTCFFVGIGYFGAEALAGIEPQTAITVVGVVAVCILAAMAIWHRKPFCPLKPGTRVRRLNLARAVWFWLWYPLWHPFRWVELWLGRAPSRRLRKSIAASFPDVRAGDIFVIRLHIPSPWGRWAHSAIAVDPQNFCHGFAKVITTHPIQAMPIRYAIAHLRVRCDESLAREAAAIAAGCAGAPMSILAGRDEVGRFSCSSLVAHAYRRAGIELVDPAVARIVPNDLFLSPQVELVRIVNTEQVTQATRRYVFEARNQGAASD